jgi:hypothetical protein
MTLADFALAAVFTLNGTACLALVAFAVLRRYDVAPRAPRLDRWVSHRRRAPAAAGDAAAYPPGNLTPSARHRDEMIRQGLLS